MSPHPVRLPSEPSELRALLELIRDYAQEIQRATIPGDAHDCAAHIEEEASAALAALHVPAQEARRPGNESAILEAAEHVYRIAMGWPGAMPKGMPAAMEALYAVCGQPSPQRIAGATIRDREFPVPVAAPRAVEGAVEPEPIVNEDVLRRLLRRADARIAELEAALAPFAERPDVVKHGALSRGVSTEYKAYVDRARAALSRREPRGDSD